MYKKLLKYIGMVIAIALLLALLVNRGMFLGIQRGLQNNFYDFASASPEIVIVGIDEKSLMEEELGPLTDWPRTNYSKAINVLNEEGAAVVGIDVTFPDSPSKFTHN